MLYYSVYKLSDLKQGEVSRIRDKIQCNFTEKVNLKSDESAVSKALLCKLLKKYYNLDEFIVDCNEKGKPFIADSNIGFNVSHSGDMIMCVCGDGAVGCDVQQIKPYNERVTKRFFTPCENELIKKCEDKARVFTVLWCLKESALKYSGEGITGGLDRYDFSAYYDKESFDMCGMHFYRIESSDYVYALCCSDSAKNIQAVSMDSLKII